MKLNSTLLISSIVALLFPILSFAQLTTYNPSFYNSSNFPPPVTSTATTPIGSINGKLDVSDNGAARYSIPIELPQGTNGMMPAISLEYNSLMGDGLLGMGWNLSAFSSIRKSSNQQAFYPHGSYDFKGYDFLKTGPFELDGRRLFDLGYNSTQGGNLYETEEKSFLNIKSILLSNNDPDYFEITNKSGVKMEYGNNSSSKINNNGTSTPKTMIWMLNKKIDNYGNYVEYKYKPGIRQPLIDEILYTGNSSQGITPYSSIKFYYTLKSDGSYNGSNTQYYDGATITNQYLLDKIEVRGADGSGVTLLVQTYRFNYTNNGLNSFLNDITVEDYNGNKLNSTSLKYKDISSILNFNSQIIPIISSSTATLNINDYFTGDYDGDGKMDILAAQRSPSSPQKHNIFTPHFYNSSNGQFNMLTNQVENNFNTSPIIFSPSYYSNTINNLDFNGDGKDDILMVSPAVSGADISIGPISIMYSNFPNLNPSSPKVNSGFSTNLVMQANLSNSSISQNENVPTNGGVEFKRVVNTHEQYVCPGDFDGNGSADFILLAGDLSGQNRSSFFTSPSTGDINVTFTSGYDLFSTDNHNLLTDANMLQSIDFDGDGKMDLMAIKEDATATNHTCELGVFYITTNNLAGTGTASASSYEATYLNISNCKLKNIKFGDFNGDRKTDIIYKDELNSVWNIRLSDGNNFISPNSNPVFSGTPIISGNTSFDNVLIGDFNGDGKSDILHCSIAFGSSNITTDVYLCKGLSSLPSSTNQLLFLSSSLSASQSLSFPLPNQPYTIADFDGDGRQEIAVQDNGISGTPKVNLLRFGGLPEDMYLEKVSNGVGLISTINYETLASSSIFTINNSAIVKDYNHNSPSFISGNLNREKYIHRPPAFNVVSEIVIPYGNIGTLNHISYNYEDAISSKGWKGFLGFIKQSYESSITNIKTTKEKKMANSPFEFLYDYKSKSFNTAFNQTLSVESLNKSLHTNTIAAPSPLSGSYKSYYLNTDYVHTVDHITGATIDYTINLRDNYNNVTQSVKEVFLSGGLSELTTTSTNYGFHGVTYMRNLPDDITIIKQRGAALPVSTLTNFLYDNNGFVTQKVDYSGTPNAITTSLTPDGFGNIQSQTISANGINTRTTTNTYDPLLFGRYLTSTSVSGNTNTGTQSLTTAYEYNNNAALWGKPSKVTNTDGSTTEFTYDDWGKTTTQTIQRYSPVVTKFNYIWDIPTHYYYLHTITPDKPETRVYYNILGQVEKEQEMGYSGQWKNVDYTYYNTGKIFNKTAPYYTVPLARETWGYDLLSGRTTSYASLTSSYRYNYNSSAAIGDVTIDVTNNATGNVKSSTIDAAGKTIQVIDNGQIMDYAYDSWGNITNINVSGTNVLTNTYDVNTGKMLSTTDKNSGTTTYQYDNLGQLIRKTDALGSFQNTYDDFGRLEKTIDPSGATSEIFYRYTGQFGGEQIDHIDGFVNNSGNSVNYAYQYDNFNRIIQKDKQFIGSITATYSTYYDYNDNDQLTFLQYPSLPTSSPLQIGYNYTNDGYLDNVFELSSGQTIFQGQTMNTNDQFEKYSFGNGETINITHELSGATNYFKAADMFGNKIQDLAFNYNGIVNGSTGNYDARYDFISGNSENFTYDQSDRLTDIVVNHNPPNSIKYSANGNITDKYDVGKYNYLTAKINAVSALTIPNNPAPPAPPIWQPSVPSWKQQITYTPFGKVDYIREIPNPDLYELEFNYGPDEERAYTQLFKNGQVIETRTYADAGEYEIQYDATTNTTNEIHYIHAGDGLCAMVVRTNNIDNYYYVHKDHLGSILTLTDNTGAYVYEQNFDAWGRYRNPQTWDYANIQKPPKWLYRGFTGHEHLPHFGLINMNGRMYDPILGTMLSPDDKIKSLFELPHFNSYTYAFNNPLRFIDPTGWDGEDGPIVLIGKTFNKVSVTADRSEDTKFILNYWHQIADNWNSTVQYEDRNISTGSFSNWSALQSRSNQLEAYREWRDYPFYHEGESYWDHWARMVNSNHMEIMNDFGGGEYNFFPSGGLIRSEVKVANVMKSAAKVGTSEIKLFGSLTEKFGEGYKSVSVARGAFVDIKYGQNLNAAAKGVWQKVYEAGYLNGSKVEVHYFYNSTTGQYANPFIKMGEWGSKAFKGLK